MKKMLLILALSFLFFTGCASITPNMAGKATGTAAYCAYSRVADGKSDKFKADVAAIWNVVNALDSRADLAAALNTLDVRFAQVLTDSSLTAAERIALQNVRDMVISTAYDRVSGKFNDSDEIIQYLLGVRQGVNDMIAIYGGSK